MQLNIEKKKKNSQHVLFFLQEALVYGQTAASCKSHEALQVHLEIKCDHNLFTFQQSEKCRQFRSA